ncbi:MAG: hypothetical protein M5U19_19045 [Microthrixaceae bacterium]|nr:hypothetical protein [Microthrixaceae bacterium]
MRSSRAMIFSSLVGSSSASALRCAARVHGHHHEEVDSERRREEGDELRRDQTPADLCATDRDAAAGQVVDLTRQDRAHYGVDKSRDDGADDGAERNADHDTHGQVHRVAPC